MKLRKILNEITSDEIVSKLKHWRNEYSAEGKDNFVKDIDSIVKFIQKNDLQTAFDIFAKSDLKYDIGTTYENLKKLKDDIYISTNFDPNWGKKSGTYIGYRAGTVTNSKNGIFFSIDEKGAQAYSNSGSREVHQYKITIKNPLVAKIHTHALTLLTGKPEKIFIDQKNKTNDGQKWWRETDIKIMNLAKKQGYDSILYTDPAPPALKELVAFNSNQVKLII